MNDSAQSGGRRLDRMTLFFVLLAGVSGAMLWLDRGGGAVVDACLAAGRLLLGITPILLAALLIAGYVQGLLPRERVVRWLGERSGARGYLLATAAGALTPGGPFAAFPLLLTLWQGGAAFDVCVVYLTSWATLGLNRILIWELPFLGHDFVALRVLASLPLPLMAGLLARGVSRRWR
jgi:uncharacterized membrane protein YraQ (UPF0718 family)